MGEAEDAERERRREKKREKKRHAKLIDVNVSEQDVEAALARRRKTEEESDAGEGKKKSKKQRMEKRQKEQQEEQQAEQQGNPQEAFSSQKRFLDQRSAANPKKQSGEGWKKLKVRALRDPKEATQYVSMWKAAKEDPTMPWKFSKQLQNWLLTHLYDSNKVDEKTFAVIVEYCKEMKGGARQWAHDDASRVVDIAAQLAAEGPPPSDDKARAAGWLRELGRMKQRKQRAETLLVALQAA